MKILYVIYLSHCLKKLAKLAKNWGKRANSTTFVKYNEKIKRNITN